MIYELGGSPTECETLMQLSALYAVVLPYEGLLRAYEKEQQANKMRNDAPDMYLSHRNQVFLHEKNVRIDNVIRHPEPNSRLEATDALIHHKTPNTTVKRGAIHELHRIIS